MDPHREFVPSPPSEEMEWDGFSGLDESDKKTGVRRESRKGEGWNVERATKLQPFATSIIHLVSVNDPRFFRAFREALKTQPVQSGEQFEEIQLDFLMTCFRVGGGEDPKKKDFPMSIARFDPLLRKIVEILSERRRNIAAA